MSTEQDITSALESIRQEEADGFTYNEADLLSAYQKKNELFSNIAIKILSIFGGLLASIAFIGSLLIIGIYDSKIGLLALGALLIIGAIFLNRESDKVIVDTMSISAYIAGIVIFSIGFTEFTYNENSIIFTIAIIAVSSLFVTQNYVLSFIAILIFNGCILAYIDLNGMRDFIHAFISILAIALTYISLQEAKFLSLGKKISRLYDPLRIGIIISLLAGLIFAGFKHLFPVPSEFFWISSAVFFLILLYLIKLIVELFAIESKLLIYSLSILILLPTALAPAVLGALIILLLSFYVNHKTGFVIGIVALIYFICQYYYDLHFTLLTKSMMLFSSGLLFLALYWIMNKNVTNEKV